MALNFRFRERTNTWPGFVDLFSNLVIILIFLLIVFVFLWTTTSVFNKNSGVKTIAELKKTNEEQSQTIAQMTADEQEAKRLLIMARSELENLEADKTELAEEINYLDMNIEELVGAYEGLVNELQQSSVDMQSQMIELTNQLNQATVDKEQTAQLEQERRDLQQQMELQRQKLEEQLASLQEALDASEAKASAQEIQYAEMSARLNKALADKVAELNQVNAYQSDFYKSIKLALGDRTTIQPDGDRFIVSSDILFASGAYTLSPEGKNQLRLIANVIKDLENKIPSDINWIIRVDGHTDRRQVKSGTRGYTNNMQLSMLRAEAVAYELARAGVSMRRLVPSGFGEMHPVALGNDKTSFQKNRRIELQLTNR